MRHHRPSHPRSVADWRRWVSALGLAALGCVGVGVHAGERDVPTVQAGAAAASPLGDAERALASAVQVGLLPCEQGQQVGLQPDPQLPGYFHLRLKGQRFHMRPVQTSTGAVRLEDTVQGAVWLQLPHKSMLMSQKQGRRLVDECKSPLQQVAADQLRRNPAPHLLDVAQSPSGIR